MPKIGAISSKLQFLSWNCNLDVISFLCRILENTSNTRRHFSFNPFLKRSCVIWHFTIANTMTSNKQLWPQTHYHNLKIPCKCLRSTFASINSKCIPLQHQAETDCYLTAGYFSRSNHDYFKIFDSGHNLILKLFTLKNPHQIKSESRNHPRWALLCLCE